MGVPGWSLRKPACRNCDLAAFSGHHYTSPHAPIIGLALQPHSTFTFQIVPAAAMQRRFHPIPRQDELE
jgi:hypothetical protein